MFKAFKRALSLLVKRLKFLKKTLAVVRKINLSVSMFFLNLGFIVAEFLRNEFILRNLVTRYFDEFYLRKNYSKDIAKILKGRITYLDVGARGGLPGFVKKYRNFMEIIMCEPERGESEVLRKEGYEVIDKALYKESGTVTFYETYLPYGSSIYKPQGPYLDFFNSDPEYVDLYRVVKKSDIVCSTIAQELTNLGVSELDFLKIDTQGSELDILKGLGSYQPLIICVELQYLPLYHGIPSAYEVCQYLINQGYVPFVLTNHFARTLCPTYGDGFFMPSWVDQKKVELILSKEEKFIALMLMFGQVEMLKFLNKKLKFINCSFIESLYLEK